MTKLNHLPAKCLPITNLHEHNSDEEDEKSSKEVRKYATPVRQRSRSFSDAEDIMMSSSSAHDSESPYQSNEDANNNNNNNNNNNATLFRHDYNYNGENFLNGLHHRKNTGDTGGIHVRQQRQNLSPIPTAYGSMPGKIAPKVRRRHYLPYILATGLIFYLFILLRESFILIQHNDRHIDMDQNKPGRMAQSPPSYTSQQRKTMEAQERTQEYLNTSMRRRLDRQHKTQVSYTVDQSDVAWYNMDLMDYRQRQAFSISNTKSQATKDKRGQPAPMDDLCGFHAQNSSLTHPAFYTQRDALNSNSRVLITGILNPIGFHLAMYLSKRCGVQSIVGIDAMYPNTVRNRLQMLERIQILTTNIPKFKPILLPYIGLDPRRKKLPKDNELGPLPFTDELNLLTSNPTHVVHLSSYSDDAIEAANDAYVDPMWKNAHSPFVDEKYDPHLLALRSSMVSMEQLLASFATLDDDNQRPHLLYASSSAVTDTISPKGVDATTKLIDEVLADTYHSTDGIFSIGLRLPKTTYGSWSQEGTVMHGLFERAAQQWNSNNMTLIDEHFKHNQLDLVYVEDVVDAVVAAMQLRTPEPSVMDISSNKLIELDTVASNILSFRPQTPKGNVFQDKSTPVVVSQQKSKNDMTRALLQWTPRTTLRDGLMKTIAWHLDRISPFGPSYETGDAFLLRQNAKTCAPDDSLCHMGKDYLPCLSECNIKDQCLPSVFDPVKELIKDVTVGCDIVLYTQSLGYDVQDLSLRSEYMEEGDPMICNFAFVPQESTLVKNVMTKVPNDQLTKFGVVPHESDWGKPNALHARKIDGLNGRLLYRGWILIWLPDAVEPLNKADMSLLKQSPGRLFSEDVQHAMFVEENFSVSPNIEDVLFLVGEMRRRSFERRTVVRELKGTEASKAQRVKYQLPPEPPRRASILFAPLRYPSMEDPSKYLAFGPDKKISVHDATKFMRFEVGLDPSDKEPADIRLQREFYERIPSFVNKNDLRSNYEPWYRYSMRHWVRTRWVVHDLSLEESRRLRCEWYQEHVHWGTDVDQLSFAHVMAKLELERRMAHLEPDDHVKTFLDDHPELRDLTDMNEWHPMETELNRPYRVPVVGKWLAQLPAHIGKDDWDREHANDNNVVTATSPDKAPIFVRIMSERMMSLSRKAWNRANKKK